jgi:DNA mismatch repair protein MutL
MISSEKISAGPRIRLLDGVLIDRIAAGEVIEAPASIIKELIENSIDAGADSIHVHTEGAGLDRIIVEDNGSGIEYEELPLSLSRHATSKIGSLDDLETILSYGFRGEALASIASVSHLELFSMRSEAGSGGRIVARGGGILIHEPASGIPGTIIRIEELFYATPARKKFIKSERTENIRIYNTILKYAIARPSIRFRYIRDGKELLLLESVSDLRDRIEQLFGRRVNEGLIEIDNGSGHIAISGYISSPSVCRSNRDGQFLFVNGRPVELKSLPYLIRKSYGEGLVHGSHPYYFIFIEGDPSRIDVNVHPAKREVRLMDESMLNAMIIQSVERGVQSRSPFRDLTDRVTTYGGRLANPDTPGFAFTSDLNHLMTRRPNTAPNPFTPQPRDDRDGSMEINHAVAVEGATPRVVPERHFGLFFNTYILAEDTDALYLIDQHTAHERINFEKIKSNIRDGIRSQEILTPVAITLTPDEMELFSQSVDRMAQFGFAAEEFGTNTIVLRRVADFIEVGGEEEYFRNLLQLLADGERPEDIFNEMAAMKACKASIKRNDHVSDSILTDILRDLNRCEEPLRCPHGRPTVVKISKAEIDRMFLRNREGG